MYIRTCYFQRCDFKSHAVSRKPRAMLSPKCRKRPEVSLLRSTVTICHPMYVRRFLSSVNKCLSDEALPQRRLRGKTQNNNKWIHTMIWALALKEKHTSSLAVQTAVAEAIMKFNAENEEASPAIVEELQLNPGPLLTTRMMDKDCHRAEACTCKHASVENLQQVLRRHHRCEWRQTVFLEVTNEIAFVYIVIICGVLC